MQDLKYAKLVWWKGFVEEVKYIGLPAENATSVINRKKIILIVKVF